MKWHWIIFIWCVSTQWNAIGIWVEKFRTPFLGHSFHWEAHFDLPSLTHVFIALCEKIVIFLNVHTINLKMSWQYKWWCYIEITSLWRLQYRRKWGLFLNAAKWQLFWQPLLVAYVSVTIRMFCYIWQNVSCLYLSVWNCVISHQNKFWNYYYGTGLIWLWVVPFFLKIGMKIILWKEVFEN